MHLRDKEKTTFKTDDANFYYEVIPFGLKNVVLTKDSWIRSLHKCSIGILRFIVDDIVVKSDSCIRQVEDLQEVFKALREHGMRLNPDKCVFGVEGGKFIGFMISHYGIEENLVKCRAIIKIRSLENTKEI